IEFMNWSTAHTINDEEYTYSDGTPINNWDNQHWGEISMREALQWSRNIPTLKLFQNVGSDKSQEFAKELGIDIDPIHESASIGGFNGTSPLQMAGAYASFGNEGVYNEPFSVEKIVYPDGEEKKLESPKSEAVMHDYTAYMVTDMLKSVVTNGTGTQANIPELPLAGKTGTTNIPNDIRQQYNISNGVLGSWFVGYTPQYSLAIWTGYPSLKDGDGNIQYMLEDGTQKIAKVLFKELMTQLSDDNLDDFKMPDSVMREGSELYIKGTQEERGVQQEKERKEKEAIEQKEKEEQEKKEQEEKEKKEQEEKEKKKKKKKKEKRKKKKKKKKKKSKRKRNKKRKRRRKKRKKRRKKKKRKRRKRKKKKRRRKKKRKRRKRKKKRRRRKKRRKRR